jgi:hypothetical protein
MDHRLSTTLHERRSRAFGLQGSFSSTRARPQRSNYGKALLFAREARAGGRSRPSLPLDANSPQLSRNPYSCARRSRQQGSLATFSVRIALSKCISSRSQDRPAFMLLRPPPEDNHTRRGFSETVEPLWRNLRGVHAPRGSVNRVPDQSTRST